MDLFTVLFEFQTLIVGVIGFSGVMFTLWFSAQQTRRARREEQEHERAVLRTALLEEMRINKNAFETNFSQSENHSDGGSFLVPTDPIDGVFRSLIDRIGLLSQEEVGAVMYAYLCLRSFQTSIHLFGAPSNSSYYVIVPVKHSKALSNMSNDLVGKFDKAIKVVERRRSSG